jgi:hypothetical protein
VWPSGPLHGYFSWYEPLVAVLSLVSIVAVPLALAALLLADRAPRSLDLARRIVGTMEAERSRRRAFSLAISALAVLTLQESLERTVSVGRLELVSLSPSGWLGAALAAAAAAAIITLVRTGVLRLLHAACSLPHRRTHLIDAPTLMAIRQLATTRVGRPLAVHGALRAPPSPAH